jgi:hypothetical protein
MQSGFAASDIDTSRPHPARMYDAYLGGNDNYPVDREAAREIVRLNPEVPPIALPTGRSSSGRQPRSRNTARSNKCSPPVLADPC